MSFDAFVGYDDDSGQWVKDFLLPEVEGTQYGYKQVSTTQDTVIYGGSGGSDGSGHWVSDILLPEVEGIQYGYKEVSAIQDTVIGVGGGGSDGSGQ